jgi:hypothetical protein
MACTAVAYSDSEPRIEGCGDVLIPRIGASDGLAATRHCSGYAFTLLDIGKLVVEAAERAE